MLDFFKKFNLTLFSKNVALLSINFTKIVIARVCKAKACKFLTILKFKQTLPQKFKQTSKFCHTNNFYHTDLACHT